MVHGAEGQGEVQGLSGRDEYYTYHQNIGFQWRYRANVMRNIPGKGKYDDKAEQTLELEGAGYGTMDQAVEASKSAKTKVWKILDEEPRENPAAALTDIENPVEGS
jgi:hypothetical protein